MLESDLIADLERQNSVHDRHDPSRFAALLHHIILTKEDTVEVVAEAVQVVRISGRTGSGALEALHSF